MRLHAGGTIVCFNSSAFFLSTADTECNLALQTNSCSENTHYLKQLSYAFFYMFPRALARHSLCKWLQSFDYKPIVCFPDMNSVHTRLFYSVSRRESERVREEECEEITIEYDKLCLRAFANVREKQRSLWRLHKHNRFQLEPAEMRVKGRTVTGRTGELQK